VRSGSTGAVRTVRPTVPNDQEKGFPMKVSEVMTRGVECTRPDASVYEAARMMADRDIGTLPVCGQNERLVGMLTDRDIVLRAVAEGQDPVMMRVREIMTPKVITCFDDQSVEEAVRLMEEHQIRRIVVLDRAKRLAGILSLGDVAVETGDELLVGEAVERVSASGRSRG